MARVLVVDDNEMNREMLARRLGRKGHAVAQAADAEAALAAAAADPPDLVLMDMSLPGLDGLEATRRLKADPATARVPVVLLTAHALESVREAATAAGCDGYDTKPVDLPRLLALIAKLTPHLPNPLPPAPSAAELAAAIPLAKEEPPDPEPAAAAAEPADPVCRNLAHLRHELRTPLNHVMMCVGELLEPSAGLPADLTAAVADLRALGDALLDTIDRLRPPTDPSPEELQAVIGRAREEIRPAAGKVAELAGALAARATAAGLAQPAADLTVISGAAEALRRVLEQEPPQPQPPSTPELSVEPEPPAGFVPARVLVVDDDATNRQLFARGLQRQGHRPEQAADGQAALDRLAAEDFDVVLLDLLMPGLSGFDVLRQLKADPDRRHIPVVIISASDDLAGVVQCLEAGAEDYLPKPCDPVVLRARLAGCLEKKRLRDRELEYLRQVQAVTAAAETVEAGTYDLAALAPVSEREDALGTLARVFGRMAGEVKAREDRLKQEVQELKVVIDERRKAAQVAEITENDYFRQLRAKVDVLRGRREPAAAQPEGG